MPAAAAETRTTMARINATERKARLAPLNRWLDQHNAACMWRTTVGPIGTPKDLRLTIEAWRVGKGIAIVTRHPSGGWDIATAANAIDVATTLRDAERRLGIICDPIVMPHGWTHPRTVDTKGNPVDASKADAIELPGPGASEFYTADGAESVGLALLDVADKYRRAFGSKAGA